MLPPLISVELENLKKEAERLARIQIGNPAARKQLKANMTRQLEIEVRQ